MGRWTAAVAAPLVLAALRVVVSAATDAGSSSAPAELVVGVLEEPQCKDSGAAVRALFAKRNSEWVPLDSAETWPSATLQTTTWTIAFDGRSLGSLVTFDPSSSTNFPWSSPRDRLLGLAPGQHPARVPNVQHRFAGWCNSPSQRPLVVLSRPHASDPEHWKPFHPAAAL